MRNSRGVNSNSGTIKCSSYPSLSTDEGSPDNPSSSSHFLHLTKSSDELGQSHLSTFSIRDYAFSNRTKNIRKSWPFSSTSLQLCLKHGLSDPLPPIQPLGSMISHPPEASSSKKPTQTHVEAISCKRKLEKLVSSDHASAETKQGFENGSKPKTQVTTVNKIPRKKCGSVLKPGACVDIASKEDQGCLFSASESMALRTCPICKAFSSASNTTLNAHIDQCLSVDAGRQPVSKPNKPRSKPRLKVKTMVDIYASAKGCTLEDLDRRNGTKWAVISSYSKQVVSDDNNNNKPEVSIKEKKLAPGVGPVYIDAKGQKLMIISEVNEKASVPSREHETINEKRSFREGKRSYKSCKKRLQGNASEIQESRRGYSEECRGMERSETPGTSQRRMLRKYSLSRNKSKKGKDICDQPSENNHSLSEDPLVLRGPSHVSTDLSEAVNSESSWRSCGDSQGSGKSTESPTLANPLRCPKPVDKGVMKLKKAWRFDDSENEDEDSGRWESEMTQERELADWDEDEETDKMFLSSSPSTSGEDNDYERWEETGNNQGDGDDMVEKIDNADAEFESMVYETTGFETEEPGSSFMEVDPIPIPGPPGSFLESPWDMGTDAAATENHGNFCQVQTSFDQLDLTDRNLSESPVSAVSNFATPETQTFSLSNIITTDKRPSGFSDNDQSCCCQREENALEGTTFRQPPPHMIHQDLLSKTVPPLPSNSGPVLRLMGKDLMVINQREETSHGDSSLKPTSQFQDLSKTQQVSPDAHLHRPYGGNGLYFDATTSFYHIP
ncbi:Hapless 8 [Hirschfeldia incana]|nr:Hapless 8 [Hirschfeldia incana]